VKELVDTDVWPAQEHQRSAHPRPGDFDYAVTVEDGDRTKTIHVHKSAASKGLHELIDIIEGHGD
jgi:hypothetical protein